MKVAIVLLIVAVTSAYASYGAAYVPGFQHTPNGIVSAYRNDQRQIHVNRVADYIGSGIGTGRFYGVPGTNGHYSNYGYGYNQGYGHNAYNAVPFYGAGHAGYGHAGQAHY